MSSFGGRRTTINELFSIADELINHERYRLSSDPLGTLILELDDLSRLMNHEIYSSQDFMKLIHHYNVVIGTVLIRAGYLSFDTELNEKAQIGETYLLQPKTKTDPLDVATAEAIRQICVWCENEIYVDNTYGQNRRKVEISDPDLILPIIRQGNMALNQLALRDCENIGNAASESIAKVATGLVTAMEHCSFADGGITFCRALGQSRQHIDRLMFLYTYLDIDAFKDALSRRHLLDLCVVICTSSQEEMTPQYWNDFVDAIVASKTLEKVELDGDCPADQWHRNLYALLSMKQLEYLAFDIHADLEHRIYDKDLPGIARAIQKNGNVKELGGVRDINNDVMCALTLNEYRPRFKKLVREVSNGTVTPMVISNLFSDTSVVGNHQAIMYHFVMEYNSMILEHRG